MTPYARVGRLSGTTPYARVDYIPRKGLRIGPLDYLFSLRTLTYCKPWYLSSSIGL
jgi:hypothetical protein